MKISRNKNLILSIIAMVAFVAIALLYNSPVLSGTKALLQPDIMNYKGSAQEMLQYQESSGENVYWSDAMFGGMPTYQTGASYNYNFIQKVDRWLRFLPRPADYIFLLFSGFFVLGMVLFRNWKYAFLGALLFGMGSYYFIVIEAGHNSKVHAIAYFAPLMAGIILLFRKKYFWGFLLTTLCMALELVANHPQMTYYFGFAVLLYIIFTGVEAIKKKEIKGFLLSGVLSLFAVLLALGMNSAQYLATYQYGKESTRGNNDVTLLQNEHTNLKGLDKDYITNWSYGKLETLNLFIPNFMGGASSGTDEYKTNLTKSVSQSASEIAHQYAQQDPNLSYEEIYPQALASLQQNISAIPTYWGTQPFTSGPAYQGAIVCFLFLLGLFIVRGKYKWWLLSATLLSIFLAWGKNMMWFTDFFIDYIPLYNKFRAVSSILVIAEFTMPLLAVLAVYHFLRNKEISTDKKKKILYGVGGGTIGFLLLLYLAGGSLFSFSSPIDSQLPHPMQTAIVQDRIDMFKADTLRTLGFVLVAFLLLFAHVSKRIRHQEIIVLGLATLTLIDLWSVDKRYLNNDNFIAKQWVENPFPTQMTQRMNEVAQQNPMMNQILYHIPSNKVLSQLKSEDPGHYRVYNSTVSTFNDASTSYFTNSIGGYHGAKLQTIQNIIDLYFTQDSIQDKKVGIDFQGKQNPLHLLNTKYVIAGDAQNPQTITNPKAMGNAWFVNEATPVSSANEAIVAISKIDIEQKAVVENLPHAIEGGNGTIKLTSYQPNLLVYQSKSNTNGFAVFSEMYYQHGWIAKVDGKETPIYKTNYFLRGIEVPQGTHEITFEFTPQVVQTGEYMMLGSYLIFVLILVGGSFILYRKKGSFS